ncbi:phosphoribosyltransferase family protein [Thermocrinis sp.]|uniref:phosphoribosyltransferase n=1 Tax=Thermocrinis sp. TaxID=2024383 RepID=UPI002FDE2979
MIFSNRQEAGRILGEWLKDRLKRKGACVVLGIPRGGVVVAKEAAKILGCPLGVLIVRKLGVPENPELAFGAIDPDGEIYLDKNTVEYFRLTPETIKKVAQEELKKIRDRERKFEKGKISQFEEVEFIVVDDGIATGMTVEAGVKYLKRKGAKRVIVAVPVCPKDTEERLKNYADEVYCYHSTTSSPFAVGMFYRDFRQVEDEEVQNLLQ